MDQLTGPELRDLLAHLLAGAAAGGTEDEWRELIGEVEVLPIWMHPRCNWRVSPAGSDWQRTAIEAAATVVRDQHPYATASKAS